MSDIQLENIREILLKEREERRLIEKKYELQTAEFNAIFQNLADAYIMMDLSGRVLKMNNPAKEILGYDLEVEKFNLMQIVTASEIERVTESFKKLIKDGILTNFKSLIKTKHGVLKYVNVNASIIYDENGNPIAAQGIVRDNTDITLERKYAKSITAEKNKYESIINNTNLGLVEVDVRGKIIAVNQKLIRMYDFPEEELVGKRIRKLFPDENVISLLDTIKNDQHLEKSKSYEIPINTKSGGKRYWSISVSPNYNIKGQIVSYIGAHMDITEAKKLEFQKDNLLKKLRKTNEDLQDYIHMVSHDLKSPLRNINASTLWLNEDYGYKFDETGVKNLNLIQSNVEKMEKMLSGILEYSSLDSEIVEMYDIDINSLLNDAFSTLIIPEHISITINNVLPVIKGDKFRLHQLFRNLLNNAIANIDKTEGIIEISSIEERSHWKFCVKDNGKGIEKGYLKKIFKVFQKLDNENNSTGIGLSIVKKIVNIYNGDIFAESEPGEGTKIHFTLEKF